MDFAESFDIGNSTLQNIEGEDLPDEICVQELLHESMYTNEILNINESLNEVNESKIKHQSNKKIQNENALDMYRNHLNDLSDDDFDDAICNIFDQVQLKQDCIKSKPVVCIDQIESQPKPRLIKEFKDEIVQNKENFDLFLDSFEANLNIENISSQPSNSHDETFNFDIENATHNPSFICFDSNLKNKDALLNKELQKTKKNLYLLDKMEKLETSNLLWGAENLSTSEKSLLHFSIDSNDISINKLKENEKKSSIITSDGKNIDLKSENIKNFLDSDISKEQLKKIANWNLPIPVLNEYKKKGIEVLFQWQVDCLSNSKVLFEYHNMVYSAPTSAGKTLVSEIIAIKTILERKKKVIFILPFVSIVREKMFYLQDLLSSSGCRVDGFFGGYAPPGGFDSINLAICTIEKANSIINRLLEKEKLESIGCIVIDEIHLISDPCRGYILELLLTKVLYMSIKFKLEIQIVSMSATLPNYKLLTEWLKAELFLTDFRPVELKEMIKIGRKLYDSKLKLVRKIDPSKIIELENDPDDILFLCVETLLEGYSTIVFCPSKGLVCVFNYWCENLSRNLAKTIQKLINTDSVTSAKLTKIVDKISLSKVKDELKELTTGCDKMLESTCQYACAFHHAGLTTEERDVVERSFKKGYLKIIVATSTLSSGVNLPARRVIIRSPLFGGKPMDCLTYKQMIGRAGRTGKDTLGESILICNENNAKIGKQLLCADLKPISSCLGQDNFMHLKRAVLEAICSGIAKTNSDLQSFINCTLYNNFHNEKHIELALNDNSQGEVDYIKECIDFLTEYEFVRVQKTKDEEINYIPSRLGLACLSSSLPPTDGLILFSELQRSRKCFVLESELHAVYLVTPYSACYQLENIDWLHYLDIWERLSSGMKKVAEIVGIKESFLVRAMRSRSKLDYKLLQIHKRFYAALALQELVNEIPMIKVAERYKCNRGLLQSLQQMSATFASIVASFCNSLNWKTLGLIVSQFKERLYFGVHHELLDLMRLTDLNTRRARALYNSGIETLIDLANSNVFTIEKVLYDSLSFESCKKQEDEDEYDLHKRHVLRKIYITGSSDLTLKEISVMLISSARKYLELQMGVKCNWKENDNFKLFTINNSEKIENADRSLEEIKNSLNTFIPTKQQILGQQTNNKFSNTTSQERDILNDLNNSSFQITNVSIEPVLQNPTSINNLHSNLNITNHTEKCSRISIIEISDVELYQTEINNLLKAKKIGLSVGLEKLKFSVQNKVVIGSKSGNKSQKQNENSNKFIIDGKYSFIGVSMAIENNFSIFIDFNSSEHQNAECLCKKLKFLKLLFSKKEVTLRIYDSKEQLKILEKILKNLEMNNIIEDPKIAHWLLHRDTEINFKKLVSEYIPKARSILDEIDDCRGHQSLGLNVFSNVSAKKRSAYDASLTNQIMIKQLEYLEIFAEELEMPIQRFLAHSEVFGITVSVERFHQLSNKMFDLIKKLEAKIYQLHGSKFNLNSTSAVARVLGLHRKTNGKISTSKQILERIDSPLSKLIINYRKINTILTKTVQPLEKMIENDKIHGNSITISSTGRISMCEPNIQNVAKDFDVIVDGEIVKISCRSAFLCTFKRCLLSADFCQLEMRILSHLSQDESLKLAINSDCDIFKSIAASWNKIPIQNVSGELRNGTKQICYGIIYGMGIKSLSENIKCTEQEAFAMSEQFHTSYPGIRSYIQKVIRFAKQNGFVETITGRRRYLEHINSNEPSLRNQAERQAVNSAIQGSAADIAKSAIIRMEKNVEKYKLKLGVNMPDNENSKVELVLHLHDELIYEVPEENVRNVAKVLKTTMENCVKLNVPLKVKLKSGKSWGEMIEINI